MKKLTFLKTNTVKPIPATLRFESHLPVLHVCRLTGPDHFELTPPLPRQPAQGPCSSPSLSPTHPYKKQNTIKAGDSNIGNKTIEVNDKFRYL